MRYGACTRLMYCVLLVLGGQFDRLERASREELIRKYLASRSHFDRQQKRPADGGGDGWRPQMASAMQSERMKEWEREDASVSDKS